MNLALKSLVLKEVTEVMGRKWYWGTIFLYLIAFSSAGIYLFYSMSTSTPQELSFIQKFGIDAYLMFITIFSMWLFVEQFTREKFADEKLLRRFETLLTNPISLKTIWEGKLLSIFLLSYPMAVINIILFLGIKTIFAISNNFVMPSTITWIIIIFIAPVLPMIYASFVGWFILRFENWKKLMGLLPLLVMGTLVGASLIFNRIMVSGIVEISNTFLGVYTLIGSFLFVFMFGAVIFLLVSRLDKEKVLS